MSVERGGAGVSTPRWRASIPLDRLAHWDLICVVLGTALAGGAAAAHAWAALRVPLGALAVLLLPGYGLAAALFPDPREFTIPEWLALALGLSLCITAWLPYVLSQTPWGFDAAPTIIGLGLVSWATAAVAYLRRAAGHGQAPAQPRGGVSSALRLARRHRFVAAVCLGGIALVGLALTIDRVVPPPPWTEFYMLGPDDLVGDYPEHVHVGEVATLRIGVVSRETEAARFHVVARTGGAVLAQLPEFELKPGALWQSELTFTPTDVGENQRLDVALVKDGRDYRHLVLRLDVAPEPRERPAATTATSQSAREIRVTSSGSLGLGRSGFWIGSPTFEALPAPAPLPGLSGLLLIVRQGGTGAAPRAVKALELVDLVAGKRWRFTTTFPGELEVCPVYAPTSGLLAYITGKAGDEHVTQVSLASGLDTNVEGPSGLYRDLAWDPAGERLAMAYRPGTAQPWRLMATDRNSPRLAPVTIGSAPALGESPQWTADGGLVFEVSGSLRMARDEKLIWSLPGASQPSVAADGKKIAYVQGQGAAARLVLTTLQGDSRPTPQPDEATAVPAPTFITVAPDGGAVIYQSQGRFFAWKPGQKPEAIDLPLDATWLNWSFATAAG